MSATGGFEGLDYIFQHGTADVGGGLLCGDDNTFDGAIYEGPRTHGLRQAAE